MALLILILSLYSNISIAQNKTQNTAKKSSQKMEKTDQDDEEDEDKEEEDKEEEDKEEEDKEEEDKEEEDKEEDEEPEEVEEDSEDEESEEDDEDDEEELDEDEKKVISRKDRKEINISNEVPGLLGTFQQLIELDKTKFNKKFTKIYNISKERRELKIGEFFGIDPDYLTSALFYTPHKYVQLGFNNHCTLYDLIQTGLLNTYIKSDDILLRSLSENNELYSLTLPKDSFIDLMLQKGCKKSLLLKRIFELKRLKKTMSMINIEKPNSRPACLEMHKDWLQDIKTPFLCEIHHKIEDGESAKKYLPYAKRNSLKIVPELQKKINYASQLKSSLSDVQYDFVKNLCENLETPKKFCKSYFDKSFWTRIIQGTKSPYYATYYCQELLKKSQLTYKSLKTCIEQLILDKDLCHYLGKRYPALSPRPNCEGISMALNHSSFFSNYKDCPGKMENEGVTNIARIIKHFKREDEKQYNTLCSLSSAAEFIKFNLDNDNEDAWNVGLCYDDKIKGAEVCLPSLMGIYPESIYSEDKTIAKILSRTRGTSENLNCQATPKQVYRSVLLKYKSGCHIIYDWNSCSAVNCQQKILYNGREVKHIRFNSNLKFNYFPNDFKDVNYAQTTTLTRGLKKKQKKVRNLTIMRSLFKKHRNILFHGIGCAEDLLPSFFHKESLWSCKPMPFIIDGIIQNNKKYSLVTRTSIDDIHAPRIIDWNHIFNAVKNYSLSHPASTWSLNAIY